MSLARRAAIGFLSFLLFVSLTGFGLAHTAKQTVLHPDFVKTEMESLDVVSLMDDILSQQIPPEVEQFLPEGALDEAMDEVLTELEPWLRGQLAAAVDTVYDYLWGHSDQLRMIIDLSPVKEAVSDSLRGQFLANPPAIISFIPPEDLENLFDSAYAQISGQIPSTYEVDEGTLNDLDSDIMINLNRARRYVGYFQFVYPALIGATALFIMDIIILDRRLKSAALWIGIPTLVSGVVSYFVPVIVRHFTDPLLAGLELPPALDVWIPHFMNDSLAPLRIFSIILIAVGVVLLIVAAVRRHRREDDYYA